MAADQSAAFWNIPLSLLLSGTSITHGLSAEEVNIRAARYGLNLVTDIHRQSLWLQFVLRFRNPLIVLLLVASALSAVTGDVASFALIMAILLLSVTMDFIQEVHAERTVDALRASVALKADILRGGAVVTLPEQEIVPGDVVMLSPGMLVPADGRVIGSEDLFVNQSLLTGESFPVEKMMKDLSNSDDDITGAVNAVFMGTSVISGSGMMLVIHTGRQTRLGQLAGMLARRRPISEFEQGVQRFGLLLLKMAVLMVLFVLLVNLSLHRPVLESFLFALALAIGLAPELLPMIVTITLARGARRMAKTKVIIKRLPAMHHLGAMDVLCTDKTGTLTEANIRLVKTIDTHANDSANVFLLAYVNSKFESGVKNPLDQAILEYSQPDITNWRKIDEVPFDFERRRVSVLVERPGNRLLIVKGAPEDLLQCSAYVEDHNGTKQDFDTVQKQACLHQFETLGDEGFRVLGLAYREVDDTHASANIADETALTFAGFAVFLDPPKASARKVLAQLARDGIQIKVISGDNERVTAHVCNMLGFETGNILTGHELATLSESALLARVEDTHVFCRITPQQKSHIIRALKQRGHTTGFLGDGINDAPALHVADIGISVDSATDVAKEAADVILLEHDLSVIHSGVIEGRRAVMNTEKYILMGSSSTFGNMFSMAFGALFLPFLPMLPIQVLLNDLLYDFSETALPFDHVDAETLLKPVQWDIGRVKRFMWILGPVSSLFDFLTFYVLLGLFHAGEEAFHTGWFVESLVTQVLIIFAIRTRRPLFQSHPHRWLSMASLMVAISAILLPFTSFAVHLGFVTLPPLYFVFLTIAFLLYLLLVEGIKYIFRHMFKC